MIDGLARYATAALGAGCPLGQLRNFVRAGLVLQPRQLAASAAARRCDAADGPTEVGFGGARGGGKSFWLFTQIGGDDCQRLPGLKCLVLRKVGKANIEHMDDLRRDVFHGLPHEFTPTRGILRFPNGSRIIAGHFQSESDIDSYLGLEYDVIGVEEATTLAGTKYEQIRTCCRSSKVLPDGSPWRPRLYSTANPGGIGHAWYRDAFVHAPADAPTVFVRSRVDDNTFCNLEYRKVLERLSGWQRKAWLDGDWDVAAGQFFSSFDSDRHVVTQLDRAKVAYWSAAMDYGFSHYTVVLLAAHGNEGQIWIVDEHVRRRWVPAQHAEAIHAMLQRHGLEAAGLRRFVAGGDAFARESGGDSVAGHYARLGITLRRAPLDRISGWAAVLNLLGTPDLPSPPRLFIHERCRRLLGTLPLLQHDPDRPEDVLKVDVSEDGAGGDDAADALRYLVAASPFLPAGASVAQP